MSLRVSGEAVVKDGFCRLLGGKMINTDDLTLRQIREVAQAFSAIPASVPVHPSVGQDCIVRAYAAGVHFGRVHSVTDSAAGREVHLTRTRRIWSWQGALSCTEIAQAGISGGKLSVEAPDNFVSGVIEIIPTSEEAEKCLRAAK